MTLPTWRFDPRVFAVPEDPDVDELVAALAPRPGLFVLDSAGGQPCRASLVGCDPVEALTIDVSTAAEGVEGAGASDDWIGRLRAFGRRLRSVDGLADDALPGPFHGGLCAALAYDLGVCGERPVQVAPEPWRLPLCQAGLYVDFFVRDEQRARTWLVLGDEPGDGRPPVTARREALFERLAEGRRVAAQRDSAPPLRPRGALVRHVTSDEHRARIERARLAIGRGEIYQANVAHRFTRAMSAAPSALYRRLRAVNPAPYMAYVESLEQVGGQPAWAIASASPELLVETDGRTARTRPIKGTIARPAEPGEAGEPGEPREAREAEDARRRATLLASEKDRAELTMIVDLERNDLGRVARPGRVWVEDFPVVQTYPALHHLVADVVCEPRPEVDAWDIVAALFPGGSITGAPKLAAMQTIAELECEGRGFFTGSVGFVDTRGHAQFNIMIRTLLWRARGSCSPSQVERSSGDVSFRVGGGITWSSDARAEDAETLVKAERLIAALTGVEEEG